MGRYTVDGPKKTTTLSFVYQNHDQPELELRVETIHQTPFCTSDKLGTERSRDFVSITSGAVYERS